MESSQDRDTVNTNEAKQGLRIPTLSASKSHGVHMGVQSELHSVKYALPGGSVLLWARAQARAKNQARARVTYNRAKHSHTQCN